MYSLYNLYTLYSYNFKNLFSRNKPATGIIFTEQAEVAEVEEQTTST